MLKLHPDMLASAYDFLRTTQPFRGWKLPESDDIGFHVVSDATMFGDFYLDGDIPTIRVSQTGIGHTNTLLATLAHEMLHLRQHLRGDKEYHGPRFKRAALSICRIHGFDPNTF